MKRRLLVICPANNVWSYNFMKLLADRYDITSFSYMPETETYREKCEKLGIRLVPNSDLAFPRRNLFDKIRFEFKLLMKYIRLRHFDAVTIQYVDPIYSFLFMLIPGNRKKTVLTYWGSDLYHTEKEFLRLLKHQIDHIRMAAFDNVDLLYEYNRVYPGNITPKKVVFLPLPVLEVIDGTRSHKPESDLYVVDGKAIPSDRIIVSIGHNGRRMQQHIPVLTAINSMDDDLKKKMVILLSVTYLRDEEYLESVMSYLKTTDLDYIVFENFLDEYEISKFRLITDIYINAVETDAFAGTVCEYFYAGTTLINAKWLHYGELDEYGFSYYEFEDFHQIPELIVKAMNEPESVDRTRNRELIHKLRSVDCCMPQWFDIIDSV